MCVDNLQVFFPRIDMKSPPNNPWSPLSIALLHSRDAYLCQLVEKCKILEKGCRGFIEKAEKIGNFRQVDTFISECKFAYSYLNAGYDVEFIEDNDDRFDGHSPDLTIQNKDNYAFIEVRQVGDQDKAISIVLEGIREIVEDVKTNVVISAKIDYDHADIYDNPDGLIQKSKNSLSQFHAQVLANDGELSPGEYTFGFVTYEVKDEKIDTAIPGAFSPKEAWKIKREPFEYIIRKVISEKARKSLDWDRKMNYYLAIDSYLNFYFPDDLASIVYGKTMHYVGFDGLPSWQFNKSTFPEVDKAAGNSWKEYLRDVYLIPNSNIRVDKPEDKGLYLTWELCRELSGILWHTKKDLPLVYPNPFAKQERNNKNYEWLGIPFRY